MLCKENGLNEYNVYNIPIAPKVTNITQKTEYLREKLKIDKNKIIVLNSGSFKYFTCADEIMNTLDGWPKEYMLVVHTYYPISSEDKYINRLKKYKSSNIRINEGDLSTDEYNVMVRSADIGIALYQGDDKLDNNIYNGKNIKMMGLSSGKLSMYASNALPIICSGNEVMKQLIAEYELGEYINSVSELPASLLNIMKKKEVYSKESRRFFEEYLAFELHWPKVKEKIITILDK
ncbi:hypothetical protein HGB13_04455 [bacterium]|nr:hypothetical protein [bacterium]